MKNRRLLCLFLAMILLLAACGQAKVPAAEEPAGEPAAEETAGSERDTTGRYALSAGGEAIIDDVDMSYAADTGDNSRVFYEIFVGSFSDSDGDGIGDLPGIINRFDYLNDGDPNSGLSLGVEGIWLSPIFVSPSYHKYNVNDYYTIDPAFGTMEDLKKLADLCESRNVKLILDLPINHTGTRHEWFTNFVHAHRQNDPDDPYYDFYCWYGPNDTRPAGRTFAQISGTDDYYECNFDGSMPELNFDNPAVRQAVLDVAKYYLDLGVDGFRFDAAKYIYYGDNRSSAEFWDWYVAELKKINPDVYIVAEVWDVDGTTDIFYSSMNCFNFTVSQTNGLIAEAAKNGSVGRYTKYVQSYLENTRSIRSDAMFVPFIANHDTDRAAGYLPASTGHLQMAANLYILGPGSPFIYYGEEIGMKGSRGGSNTDANRRLAMRWGDGDTVQDPEGTTYNDKSGVNLADQLGKGDSPYNYYKRLIMIRRANPEIARGNYTAVTISNSKVGGFVAELDGSSVLVLHNTGDAAKTLELSGMGLDYTRIVAVIGMDDASLDGTSLTIGPQTSVVLR